MFPDARAPARRHVLLGQLVSNGDCLYATTVARQIKHDDPDCHLTWAISERCKAVLDGNPHVDALWVWPAFRNEEILEAWSAFKQQALARQASGEFDAVYFTQAIAENSVRWDGNLRSTIFQGYPRRITVPIAPVVCLSAREVENVRQFAARHGLSRLTGTEPPPAPPVILFECAPGSGQSFVTPAFALDLARRWLERFPDLRVIISSHLPISGEDARILDGSRLSFRENAELSHYCSLLVGCSSGLSWLCISDAARRLPTVQVLTNHTANCNPLSADHERWGLSTDHLIELFDCSAERVDQCVEQVLQVGFAPARQRFHQRSWQRYHTYGVIFRSFFYAGEYRAAGTLLWRNRSVLLHPLMWAWHFGVLTRWLAWRCLRSYIGKGRARFRCF